MKVFRIVLLAVGALIATLLTIPLFLASEYYVEREITIDRSPNYVFAKATDYSIRGQWDPWLEIDPTASYAHNRTDDLIGSEYSWEGDTIGVGKMTIVEFERPVSITTKLEFIKPFESQSDVFWKFTEIEDGKTHVTWANSGQLPYIARYFASSLEHELGHSFEKGLSNFKILLESMPAPADTTKGD